MNSLYGRFGINPNRTISEICDTERKDQLIRKKGFTSAHPLCENKWLCTYINKKDEENEFFSLPKNAAVQISAAITASARMYMYEFLNRDDCYVTIPILTLSY